MTDKKLSELTEEESPTTDALVYVVNDPDGTPVDRKVARQNLGIISNPGSGEHRIVNIRLNAGLEIVITYDDVPEA